jgi:Domain of unknown function (DUF4166)
MSTAIFKHALGNAFNELPPLLQQLHNGHPQRWVGDATVTWGKTWWVRLLLALARLPRPGRNIPCHVDFEPTPDGECLRRNFAGQRFHSHLRVRNGVMVESFGPVQLRITNTVRGQQLLQHCTASQMLGLPLPRALAMRVKAREWCSETGMHFDVSIGLGGGIQFLRYRGCLLPDTAKGA